jgi:hypothetical protein
MIFDLSATNQPTTGGTLLLRITRLALMPDGKNQHDIFCREPPILGDVAITAAREDELPAAVLGLAPQQRMIGQQFERAAYAYELFVGSSGVFCGDEIEETLEISHRPLCYFDARHVRALGRRAFAPATRPSR